MSESNTCFVLISIGFPKELKTLPIISLEIFILKESSVKVIVEFSEEIPAVSSNTSIVIIFSSIFTT
ncbi:hypothetical protein ES708_29791 [subsurface metagenome]